MLHLHRLKDEEELTFLDLLALFDEHLHDRAWHGGRKAGGGISARPCLVDGRRLGLMERVGLIA